MTQQQFKGARVERHGCAERHGVLALSLPLPQSMLIPVRRPLLLLLLLLLLQLLLLLLLLLP